MGKRQSSSGGSTKRAGGGGGGGGGGGALGAGTRFVVLHGKEPFLRQAYVDQLRETLDTQGLAYDYIRFDGAQASVSDVLDECRSFGLMASHKVVVVDNAEEWVKGDQSRPLVERYAESPCDATTLVLRAETWRPGKLDKLIDALGPAGGIIKCDEVSESQAEAWARQRVAKRHGRQIEPEAARLLVSRLGADLGRIDSELAKLSTATPEGEPVSVRTVRELVGVSREEEVWGIQAELLSGQTERCLIHLHELLTVSRVPTVLLRWAMTDLARKVHGAARGLASGVPAPAVAGALKLWGPSKDAVLSAGRRVSPAAAAELLEAAVEADAAGKTGRGDETRALEMLTIRMTRTFA